MNFNQTGFDYLESCFAQYSARALLVFPDERERTYGEFWSRAESYASRLTEIGLKTGERFLVKLDDTEESLLLCLAALIGGFVMCPVDPSFPLVRIESIRDQIEARFICEESNRHEWTSSPKTNVCFQRPPRGQDDFLVVLSSGTTNAQKGILHTADTYIESARSFAKLVGHGEETSIYHHLPTYYMAGIFNLFFVPIVSGSRIVVGPRFTGPQMLKFWEVPRKCGVNHLTITPTMALMLAKIFRQDDGLLDHIQKYEGIVSTSALLLDSVAKKFYSTFGVPLLSCYGVTEVGGSITLQSWDQAIAQESVGRFNAEVEIQAGNSAEKVSEILVKTSFMMKGYLVSGKIQNVVDSNGFFHTGDLGYLKDGSLFVTGREHDLVKKGGEFVSLPAVEDVALRISGVSEVAAAPVPDEFWGAKIVLFYVPEVGCDLDYVEKEMETAFIEFLRPIERPDKVIPVPMFKKTSVGKIIKRELVERYTV